MVVALVILAAPVAVHAQASIAGTVKDTSGALLPGVTVEASSPALIEKIRTAVSDGTGQYRIENLRPGLYTVKFVLTGFSAVSREGVELSGSATVSVNADLRVGSLEETVTVTGESPVVDLQSAQRQTVLTNDVIKAIPTAGSYNALLVLVPALARRAAGREHGSLQLLHVQRARHAAVAGRKPREHRRRGCWWTASASPCPRPAAPTTSPTRGTRRK